MDGMMEDSHYMDTGLSIFGRSEDERLPKFACGLVGCCEGKKKCCKKYKDGKRCKSCPKR
jgi:hypothetical protein